MDDEAPPGRGDTSPVEIEESEPGEPPAKRLRKEDAGESEKVTIGRHCRTVMQDPCIGTQKADSRAFIIFPTSHLGFEFRS